MERAVIIGRVVSVVTGFNQLIDKPAVDSFVEVRRLHSEQEKSQKRGESDDEPRRPLAFGERVFPGLELRTENWKIR